MRIELLFKILVSATAVRGQVAGEIVFSISTDYNVLIITLPAKYSFTMIDKGLVDPVLEYCVCVG